MPSRSNALLVGLVLLLVLLTQSATAWWLRGSDLPDGFQNEYEHLYTLTEVYFRARDGGLAEADAALWGGYYPPGIHAVASAGMAVFGRSRAVATLSLTVFLLALLGATAAITKRVSDLPTAAVAVALLAGYPAIFGNVRRYEPNIALAGLVALALAFLILRGLNSRRDAVLFGLICGAGLLVDRMVFAVYLLPPLLFAGRGWLRDRSLRPLGALAVAALVAAPFYVRFARNHLGEITSQLGGEVTSVGAESQSLPAWTPLGLGYYPLSFLEGQMGLVLGLATIAGIALHLAKRQPDPRLRLVEAWGLGGLLIVTLVAKKQPFYSIPLLAPLAVLAAMGWRAVPLRSLRIGIVAIVALASLHQATFLTRGEGLLPSPGRWVWFAGASPFPPSFLGHEYTMAWANREQDLRLEHAAELCADTAPYTLLHSDAHGAYEGQVMPTLRLLRDTRLVEGALMAPGAFVEHADQAGCFVYITDSDREWPDAGSVAALYDSRGIGQPPPELAPALHGLRSAAALLESWDSAPGERVLVYRIAPR